MSYEWGLVVVDVILFILFAELYKMVKRRTMKPLSGGTDANTEMDPHAHLHHAGRNPQRRLCP
ncbi:hypothetical protein MVEG_04567 [Podila verticillata NRRL 6337]|nr:hypothetical protein MVEG_04567 [Podila verticillata NRRL 6337]